MLWERADLQDLAKAPSRELRDAILRPDIQRIWDANFNIYGVRKVRHQQKREGFDVAKNTVTWLMKQLGPLGALWGKFMKTPHSDTSAPCPQDKVSRQFRVSELSGVSIGHRNPNSRYAAPI